MNKEILFRELTLPNGQKIKNRFFKSAMNEALSSRECEVTKEHIKLYETWARGGVGLLISGNVMVDRAMLGEPGNVVVDELTNPYMLADWAKAGKKNNAKMWLQLNHPGKQSPKSITKEPVAPSAIPLAENVRSFFNDPRELTNEEIKDIINKFINAAKIAEKAGFDGVQLHAAHGYLISQFLSSADNVRTDEYGGSLENRMRFLLEIYQGIREVTKPNFAVGIKINSTDFKAGGFSEEDSLEVIKKLAELNIDLIEISGGSYEKPRVDEVSDGEVFFLDFAKKVADLVSTPIVLTGGFTKQSSMVEVLSETNIAMVGIARALVQNPYLVNDIEYDNYMDIKLPRLTTKIKKLDQAIISYVAISYYEQQMARIGKGMLPVWTTNAWSPLLNALKRHGLAAVLPKRAKKK